MKKHFCSHISYINPQGSVFVGLADKLGSWELWAVTPFAYARTREGDDYWRQVFIRYKKILEV